MFLLMVGAAIDTSNHSFLWSRRVPVCLTGHLFAFYSSCFSQRLSPMAAIFPVSFKVTSRLSSSGHTVFNDGFCHLVSVTCPDCSLHVVIEMMTTVRIGASIHSISLNRTGPPCTANYMVDLSRCIDVVESPIKKLPFSVAESCAGNYQSIEACRVHEPQVREFQIAYLTQVP